MDDDRFRDPRAVKALGLRIAEVAKGIDRDLRLMEVCGTHTHAVAAAGLRRLLPPNVTLVSGPGCPVCVTPVSYLDRALALLAEPDVLLCTFGDLLRVPASRGSLERARAKQGRVEVIYSARDSLDIAAQHSDQRVILLAVGFETTAPTITATLLEAEDRGLDNLLLLPGCKTMPAPLESLASDPDLQVDGFLLPGHVSVVTGADAFSFLSDRHNLPAVVAGFTPVEVLDGVLALLLQLRANKAQVQNRYPRAVTPEGNRVAQRLMSQVFEPRLDEWRGLGTLPDSGLGLRPELAHRDASLIPVVLPEPAEPTGCRCGDVLKGAKTPPDCPLFRTFCTPERPTGACMVSGEGACAAWYRYTEAP